MRGSSKVAHVEFERFCRAGSLAGPASISCFTVSGMRISSKRAGRICSRFDLKRMISGEESTTTLLVKPEFLIQLGIGVLPCRDPITNKDFEKVRSRHAEDLCRLPLRYTAKLEPLHNGRLKYRFAPCIVRFSKYRDCGFRKIYRHCTHKSIIEQGPLNDKLFEIARRTKTLRMRAFADLLPIIEISRAAFDRVDDLFDRRELRQCGIDSGIKAAAAA